MKKSVLLGITLGLAAGIFVTRGAFASATAVGITNFAFVPAVVTIPLGTVVTWTNMDNVAHTTTSDERGWDSSFLIKGKSFSIQFNKAGTFTYHCDVHPSMKAVVIVK